MFTKTEKKLAPEVYRAIKRIAQAKGKEWEWEPEIGDFFLIGKEMGIVVDEDWVSLHTFKGIYIEPKEKRGVVNIFYIEKVVPVLHWEKLEKIMNSLGYCLILELIEMYDIDMYDSGFQAVFWEKLSKKDNLCCLPVCKTRQEAVMQAIIKSKTKR